MNNTSEGYKAPSRFDPATVPHKFVGPADQLACSLCTQAHFANIHHVLTHNPDADEAERLRVRETFVLKDHMAGVRDWVQEAHPTPGMDNTDPAPAVTVTLEQAIIIAKHYLLFDELETRAKDAEARAVTAEAFAASALKELSELKANTGLVCERCTVRTRNPGQAVCSVCFDSLSSAPKETPNV